MMAGLRAVDSQELSRGSTSIHHMTVTVTVTTLREDTGGRTCVYKTLAITPDPAHARVWRFDQAALSNGTNTIMALLVIMPSKMPCHYNNAPRTWGELLRSGVHHDKKHSACQEG